ncbi:glycosyltransferase family 4 protein [Microbulbifer thermotolerans]|uniref:glycosyltransferase family 4 protein n=1 Tax=Microbulbifer thermotolerans TaxID=252514 RepID=UPI002248C61C|nr:glycosyltransferase family 4 protein [Microbulbifer thermotolerans]MCX2832667.1 glycosyltransferase family 4 protein [Microbulbifer thermotolerans]
MFYKTVLVVTDKFPPEVSGGAELSLNNMLSEMKGHNVRIVIAALSPGRYILKKEIYCDRLVYRVPFEESWPVSVVSAGKIRLAIRLLKYFIRNFSRNNFRSVYRVMIAGLVRKFWSRHAGSLPLMDADVLINSRSINILKKIVLEVKPDVIHADNYRSIVLANNLGLSVPVFSYVRDNRFFCAHKNQAANIKGKICIKCDSRCVEEKFPRAVELGIKSLMLESLEIRREALAKSSVIAATSQFLCEQVKSVLPGREVIKIPNLIESATKIDAVQKGIKKSSIPEILVVGMIGHNKGQAQLIEIAKHLQNMVDDFRIVIAGRGQMANKILSDAEAEGIRDYFWITGFLGREELYRAYARSTVVACPTVWPEPFGRVPFEAAMSSRPVVAYAVGGLKENIVDGKTGVLVSPGDKEEFSRAIAMLINNKEVNRNMGRSAREHVQSLFLSQDSANLLSAEWERLARIQ